jgi:hypothetical protein
METGGHRLAWTATTSASPAYGLNGLSFTAASISKYDPGVSIPRCVACSEKI